MKTSSRFLAALFLFSFISFVQGGNFVSQVLLASQPLTITIPGNHFLLIRNFTQECCSFTRGTVSITKDGLTINNAFVASFADNSLFSPNDPINEFVVAGPATVT